MYMVFEFLFWFGELDRHEQWDLASCPVLCSSPWSRFTYALARPFFDAGDCQAVFSPCIDVAAHWAVVGDGGDRWFALGDFTRVHHNLVGLFGEVLIDSPELNLLSGSFVDGPAPGRAAGDSE